MSSKQKIDDIEHHRKNAFRHSLDRFKERYGVELEPAQYTALCDLIKQRKSNHSYKMTGGRFMHWLNIGDKNIAAVWCPKLKCIVTFMPKKSLGKSVILKSTDRK